MVRGLVSRLRHFCYGIHYQGNLARARHEQAKLSLWNRLPDNFRTIFLALIAERLPAATIALKHFRSPPDVPMGVVQHVARPIAAIPDPAIASHGELIMAARRLSSDDRRDPKGSLPQAIELHPDRSPARLQSSLDRILLLCDLWGATSPQVHLPVWEVSNLQACRAGWPPAAGDHPLFEWRS